jgi:formate-dependent nitrite reductase membrane component NrfD
MEERMMADKPLFDTLIILYLFLGGAAAGAFFVMSAWSLMFHRKGKSHHFRLKRAFKSLMARCYTIGLAVSAFSAMCLVWDLGSPERVLSLFTRPHPTAITFGSYALLAELSIGSLLALANLFDLPAIKGAVRKVLEACCCVCSGAVMVYTGVFLAGNASVPFWNTGALIVLFSASSLSAGISIVLLIDYFIKDQTLLLRAARPLQKAHLAVLLAEMGGLALFLASVITNPFAARSVLLLMDPDMLSTAIVGVVGMGIVAPLALESSVLGTKESRSIPVSDVVCLLGGFCLRYVIVSCGTHA